MRRNFLFISLLLVLAGCAEQPLKAVTSIEVLINEYRYVQAQWRIPSGEQITLRLTNESDQEHEWLLLKESPSEPFSADDEAKVFFRVIVGAGETRRMQFKAPAAPGEYSAACSKPGHLEKGEIGRVLVVQPGY
ncbi:MAG: cupredoxin domain-containing protein [Saprospiraceae bacterium]|nr:cupredoxin domain-containing protein [Saprospiraceae bacterium]